MFPGLGNIFSLLAVFKTMLLSHKAAQDNTVQYNSDSDANYFEDAESGFE